MYRVSAPRKVADCVVSRSCTDDSACELEHTFRQEEKKKKMRETERKREGEGEIGACCLWPKEQQIKCKHM